MVTRSKKPELGERYERQVQQFVDQVTADHGRSDRVNVDVELSSTAEQQFQDIQSIVSEAITWNRQQLSSS